MIRDTEGNSYRLIAWSGEQALQFNENGHTVKIGSKTRELLKSNNVESAEVLCRVKIPQNGEQLFIYHVDFRF